MMTRRALAVLGLCLPLWLLGCPAESDPKDVVDPGGNGDNGGGDGDPTDAPPAPYDTLTWSISSVEIGGATRAAGYQGALLRGPDGTLYYVYLKHQDSSQERCDIAAFGGTPQSVTRYDLRLAVRSPADGTWSTETVPLEQAGVPDNVGYVTNRLGLDAVINEQSGDLVIATAAGGPGQFTCGSSDLVVATRSSGGSWSFQVPVTGSESCCATCEEPACCSADAACLQGTDVGSWAAVALDGQGNASVAYVDTHFYSDHEGKTYQGYELWESQGNRVSGIRPWSGSGMFGALSYVDGEPVVAYSLFAGGGLVVGRRVASGGTADSWEEKDLMPGYEMGERLRMAVAPDGTLGLLAHVAKDSHGAERNDLLYCASSDGGVTWPRVCESIDETRLHLGHNPSLVYDEASRPHVSYYVCGAVTPCSIKATGLRYGWRDDTGHWWTFDAHFDASVQSGVYSSLALDPSRNNAPTIVFMDLTRGAAMTAQGSFGP